MKKAYKLVYEKNGGIYGSYSGIPKKTDALIVTLAELEGKIEPSPRPKGTINITENGVYDIVKFASAKVDVKGMIPTGKKLIIENGTYNIEEFKEVEIKVPQGVFPEGELDINENGSYDVTEKVGVNVNVPIPPEYIIPEGTKEIRNNGEFNIREFEKVNVDVPGATTKELFEATENGTYDIAEYANVKVDVPNPSTGILNIDANGEYDVTEKAGVNVNVPNPSVGVLNINANGEYDVTEKAGVNVAVPQPSGKAPAIVANGTNIDIKDYETVDVNVPNPSTGTLEITENGEHDVTDYATVDVDVKTAEVPTTMLENIYEVSEDNVLMHIYPTENVANTKANRFFRIPDTVQSISKDAIKDICAAVNIGRNTLNGSSTYSRGQAANLLSYAFANTIVVPATVEEIDFSFLHQLRTWKRDNRICFIFQNGNKSKFSQLLNGIPNNAPGYSSYIQCYNLIVPIYEEDIKAAGFDGICSINNCILAAYNNTEKTIAIIGQYNYDENDDHRSAMTDIISTVSHFHNMEDIFSHQRLASTEFEVIGFTDCYLNSLPWSSSLTNYKKDYIQIALASFWVLTRDKFHRSGSGWPDVKYPITEGPLDWYIDEIPNWLIEAFIKTQEYGRTGRLCPSDLGIHCSKTIYYTNQAGKKYLVALNDSLILNDSDFELIEDTVFKDNVKQWPIYALKLPADLKEVLCCYESNASGSAGAETNYSLLTSVGTLYPFDCPITPEDATVWSAHNIWYLKYIREGESKHLRRTETFATERVYEINTKATPGSVDPDIYYISGLGAVKTALKIPPELADTWNGSGTESVLHCLRPIDPKLVPSTIFIYAENPTKFAKLDWTAAIGISDKNKAVIGNSSFLTSYELKQLYASNSYTLGNIYIPNLYLKDENSDTYTKIQLSVEEEEYEYDGNYYTGNVINSTLDTVTISDVSNWTRQDYESLMYNFIPCSTLRMPVVVAKQDAYDFSARRSDAFIQLCTLKRIEFYGAATESDLPTWWDTYGSSGSLLQDFLIAEAHGNFATGSYYDPTLCLHKFTVALPDVELNTFVQANSTMTIKAWRAAFDINYSSQLPRIEFKDGVLEGKDWTNYFPYSSGGSSSNNSGDDYAY